MQGKRILVSSDIHVCYNDWHGIPTDERMTGFVKALKEEYKKRPFEALLLLGDYSLDFWNLQPTEPQASYFTRGISDTARFVKDYLSQIKELPIDIRMIAGNHEQYGYEKWKNITGYSRQDYCICDNFLFILLDTFAGNLDPTEFSDGTYTGADTDYIEELMQRFPRHNVILCAHFFNPDLESERFKSLLRENARIKCMVCGHNHYTHVNTLGEDFGGKSILYDGNYSYTKAKVVTDCMWGFREIIINGDSVESKYITPKNRIIIGESEVIKEYGEQDFFKI